KEAWRHWLALLLALACSLGVAALWGANIAALFPIIETTLHGEPLQTWNQNRIDRAKQEIASNESATATLKESLGNATTEKEKTDLSLQLTGLESQAQMARLQLKSAEHMQPLFD